MSGIRLVLLVVSFLWLPVVSCSEVADSPRPTHGARIAEPEAGTWTWLCAVSVQGAEYAESSAKGSGVGSTREAARTVAVRDACAKAGGGKSCENASVGWELGSAMCKQVKKDNPVQFECEIDVHRPSGAPSALDQAEAAVAKRACLRAKRGACAKINGGDACMRGIDGWSSDKSLGRRR